MNFWIFTNSPLIWFFSFFHVNCHRRNDRFQKISEIHIWDEFVKVREFRLKNENFGISRNSAYSFAIRRLLLRFFCCLIVRGICFSSISKADSFKSSRNNSRSIPFNFIAIDNGAFQCSWKGNFKIFNFKPKNRSTGLGGVAAWHIK